MAGVTAKEILKLLLQAGVVGVNANPLYRAALTAGGVPSHLANNISRQDMGAFMAKQYPIPYIHYMKSRVRAGYLPQL